jgi:hypothetical protein
MLKFSVQTFYQPLFSHTFFPLAILFPSKSFPHQKSPKQKPKPQKPSKTQSKSQRQKAKKKTSSPFINSGKQGGAEDLGEGRDIVTGETCVPACLNTSLGDAAVLLFLFHDQGCAYLGLHVKVIKLHLLLLTSSSQRLFIICSPHNQRLVNRYS